MVILNNFFHIYILIQVTISKLSNYLQIVILHV